MKHAQQGFTIIELFIVLIILGVLTAFAIPRFMDLRSDANTAATKGVAEALSSASNINYATRKAKSTKGVAISNCTDAALTLQGGALPAEGYTITSAAVAPNTKVVCTLTGRNGATATFSVMGIQ